MDRVGILVELMGNDKAMRSLSEMKSLIDSLKKDKLRIEAEIRGVESQLQRVRAEIKSLTSQRDKIRLDTSEIDKATKALDQLTSKKKSATERLSTLRSDFRQLAQTYVEQIHAIDRQITMSKSFGQPTGALKLARESARNQLNALRDTFHKQRDAIQRELNDLNKQINRVTEQRNTAKATRSSALATLDKQLTELKAKARDLENTLGSMRMDMKYDGTAARLMEADFKRAQAAAISLRDVLSGAGQWFSTIGSGLQSIGGIFNTDVWSYITQTLTQLGTQSIMSNLDAASKRFDTFNTYAPYMEAVGISAERANESLNEVDQSIRGLPIGLDEAAIDIRRTTMLMDGDVETATKYVEGFNQALVAGGAPAQMQNYARLEMQRLLASGELSQKRQWMSLINGLGVSTQYLKNAMGYTDMTTKEFEDMVYDPDRGVEGEEVIRGFAKLADDEGLQELIKIYKTTVESGMSNLHYALVRGLQRVFDAGNETMEATIGMNFSEYLESGRDFIDEAFLGVADWIRKNPDTIKSIFDEVEGLAHRAEQFDWGSLAHSIIGSIESIVDIATWIYDHVPEGVLQKFITFSMVWASPLGKGFSAIGNLLTTLAYLPFPRLGGLTRGLGGAGRFVGNFKSMGKGLLGAAGFVGIIAEVGAVILEYTKVAEAISKADLTNFDKNIGAITKFVGKSGGMTAFLTGIFSVVSALPGGAVAVGLGELLSGGSIALIGEMGKVIGEFANVATAIANANIPSEAKMDRMFHMINTIFSNTSDVDPRLGARMRTKTMQKMIDMLEDLSDAMPALQNIADYDIDASTIENTVQTILNVYETIDSSIVSLLDARGDRTNTVRESTQNADIIENVTAVIEDLGATIDAIAGIEDKLNEYGLFNSPNGGENQSLTRIGDTLDTIIAIMTEVSDAVTQKKGVIETLGLKIVSGMEDDIIKNYNDAIQSVADLIDTMQSNRDTFNSIMTGHGHNRTLDPGFYAIKDNIKMVLDSISNDEGTGMLDDIYKHTLALGKRIDKQDWEGIATITTDMDTAMEAIVGVFDTIKNNAYKLMWVGQMHHDAGAATFSGTIANLNNAIDSIADLHIEKLGDLTTDNISKNTEALYDSVEEVINIAYKLSEWNETLAAVTTKGGAVSNFTTLINDLRSALSGDNGTLVAANYTAMATSIDTLQTALSGIANINLGNVVGDIKDMADNLKDLAQKSKDGAKYLNDLRDKMIAAANAANNNSSKYDGYIRSLSSVATQALRGYDNVSSLINALNAISDKTITIQINTPGLNEAVTGLQLMNSLSGVASGINNVVSRVRAMFSASGGKVNYLAKGGTLFHPQGTDTVPAMLTPGEWVINRRASRAFGDNFMRKINNMDIPGAMDALMQRSKWVPNGGVSYNTYNYNNQSVTQHFSDKKDSRTSYRRANRYLGAL